MRSHTEVPNPINDVTCSLCARIIFFFLDQVQAAEVGELEKDLLEQLDDESEKKCDFLVENTEEVKQLNKTSDDQSRKADIKNDSILDQDSLDSKVGKDDNIKNDLTKNEKANKANDDGKEDDELAAMAAAYDVDVDALNEIDVQVDEEDEDMFAMDEDDFENDFEDDFADEVDESDMQGIVFRYLQIISYVMVISIMQILFSQFLLTCKGTFHSNTTTKKNIYFFLCLIHT